MQRSQAFTEWWERKTNIKYNETFLRRTGKNENTTQTYQTRPLSK